MGTKVNLYKQSNKDDGTRVNFNVPRSLTYGLNARANDDGGVSEADNCTYNTLNGINTLLSSASLMLTPSSYKEGKLYSVIPSNGNGDFTVTRATTATRVNSAGLVELVPYNLLSYSEQFNNASWIKTNTTIGVDAGTAPDGTLTADKLIPTLTNDLHICESSTVSFVLGNSYTFSFYAKKAENNFVQFTASSALLSTRANFNLLNGTLGTVDAGITATITAVDNNWYRCTASFTATASGSFRAIICCITNSTAVRFQTFAGNGTSGIYTWGAQLVEGSNELPYQKTETRLNIPRLDYSLGGCPNILLEPQRTNLALQSSSFDNASWFKSASGIASAPIVLANSVISPSGLMDADKVTFTLNGGTSSGDISWLYQNITLNNATTYTLTAYVKASAPSDVGKQLRVGNVVYLTDITLTADWQRIVVTETAGSTASRSVGFRIRGNEITNNVSMDIWGVQLEEGSYATSYIPTTSASVTRNADVVSKTGISSLIGQTEGTLFLDFNYNFTPPTANGRLYSIFNTNEGVNSILPMILGVGSPNINQFQLVVFSNGVVSTPIMPSTSTLVPFGRQKFAIAYDSNGYTIFRNGALFASNTGTLPLSLSTVEIGCSTLSPTRSLGNSINSSILWKERLTNDQLEALTGQGFDTYAAMASYYNYTLQ